MTQKWVIMVWLTRNPASARHAASADQSNALLQRPLPTKLRITVATVYIQSYNRMHWHQSCPGKAAAGGCPSAPDSGARPQLVPAPARCANADGTRRRVQGSPKHASKPEGENRSSRRLGNFKSEIPPEIESKPEVLVEDHGKRGSTKRESTEVPVEAWSSRMQWVTHCTPWLSSSKQCSQHPIHSG